MAVLPVGPWGEDEKASLRNYLFYPALFHQFEPKLEQAITAVQSVADGGALPTDATQQRIRMGLARLYNVEKQIGCLYELTFLASADEDKVQMDALRAIEGLKNEGQRIILGQIGAPLGTNPVDLYFFPDPDRAVFGEGASSSSRAYPFFGASTIF